MQIQVKYKYWRMTLLMFFCTAIFAQETPYEVVWADIVGCVDEQGVLQKTVKGNDWKKAGASSVNILKKGEDGWFSTTVVETNTQRMIGMARSNDVIHYESIDYAIFLIDKGRTVRVYEKGKNKGDLETYQKDDVFKIERTSGTIKYLKNDTTFYTSTVPSKDEMMVDVNIKSYKGTVANVRASFDVTKEYKKFSNDTTYTKDPENPSIKHYKVYNKRGNLKIKGAYKNDQKGGLWTYFHNNGKIEKLEEYKNNEANGISLSFQDSGMSSRNINFEFVNDTIRKKDPSNPRLEHLIIYDEDGKLASIGDLLNNQKSGTWKEFAKNGSVRKLIDYQQNQKNGAYYLFDENGGIIEEANYKNEALEGKRVQYKLHGKKGKRKDERVYKPKMVEHYQNGKLHGVFKNYYGNGELQESSVYQNGIKNGASFWYHDTGELLSEFEYKDGVLTGASKSYYENGQVKSESNYINSKLHDLYRSYHENGSLEKEGMYDKGKKDGKWLFYDESGKVEKTEWYEKGELKKSK